MPYRKVGYAEQCWYMIRFKIRHLFRRKKKKRKKDPDEDWGED